jgi:peptide/nickel transport system permease protein
MIPTLFGITVVAFVIMQMAPGDPLLDQLGTGAASGEGQTRESYLIQKRDLKLDKPLLWNFNYFRDFESTVRTAAHLASLTRAELLLELESLGVAEERRVHREALDEHGKPDPPTESQARRLDFLRGLKIKKFDEWLFGKGLGWKRWRENQVESRRRLAEAIPAFLQSRMEDLGAHGVPEALAILDSDAPANLKIGAIRLLNFMVVEPFIYTYSRTPSEEETPLVRSVWKTWWERERGGFPSLEPQRRSVLRSKLDRMLREESQEKIFEQIESFDREDLPFFAELLLADGPLSERSLASQVLRLYAGRPLRLDLTLTATATDLAVVKENWRVHYEARRDLYHPGMLKRVWFILADTQYAHMVWRLVSFDFGRSALKARTPVSELIWKAVLVSAPIMLLAQFFIYLFAVPLGIVCGVKRGTLTDRGISFGLFVLYSIPAFVAGMIFLVIFCYGQPFAVFPMQGLHTQGSETWSPLGRLLDYLWHIALPVVCLSLFGLAALAMYSRTAMLDVIGQDYIRTARAKGLSEKVVVLKHALRNSLIPILTLFANFLPAMLGGSVLIERIFGIPGMGYLSLDSILNKDIPTLMALIYIQAILVMLSILLTDLLYVFVDPRISFERQGKTA